ncbi:thiamine phosphate synthase [Halobiforma lacisalsi AJ5]|uniref:Thiamine-phosphate synthase n=1 Tax=Natronobacterium lacisalsi AJ5 TaxID=358396 RepID=M0LLN8_NATLA|nr:thiamine phosphate synthase [Halobiforma lacisalsi]APW97161.1 thiamine phosphate synthase [Halobiforma lacisalsi AJ5]EMA33993.1 thiamine-phosphate pyrophosphorylase [Halobiforma lacisalsi AJ5]
MPRNAAEPSNWRTYLVTQESVSNGRSTLEIVREAIAGGIDVVQLREKETDARWRHELGLELRELTAEAGVDLIVNDRVDIAEAIDADGVHVGQSDLPVAVARDLLGPEAIVGCSAATVEQAHEAEAAGADYLGVGTIYGTTSKDVAEYKDGVGPERVAEIADAVSIPVVGIGGITAENAGPVVEAGAVGVSVISEITAAPDPRAATESLAEAVETAKGVGDGEGTE